MLFQWHRAFACLTLSDVKHFNHQHRNFKFSSCKLTIVNQLRRFKCSGTKLFRRFSSQFSNEESELRVRSEWRCQKKWSQDVRSEWRSQKWCEKYLFSRSHFLVWRFLSTITDHVFKTSLSMLLDHLEELSSRGSFERKARNTQRDTQIYSYRKLVENCMREMQIFKVRCKLCKLSIYHSYTIFLTHTCSLKIERKIRYLCCFSM